MDEQPALEEGWLWIQRSGSIAAIAQYFQNGRHAQFIRTRSSVDQIAVFQWKTAS